MRRGLLKIGGVVGTALLAVAGIAGCTPKGAQTASQPSQSSHTTSGQTSTGAAKSTTYTMGEIIQQEQVTNFNPFLSTGNWTQLFDYIYNPLFYFNPVKGKLIPELASSTGTWSSDHKTYTVQLNTKAQWQDGKSFTAADVVYTFDALKNYKVLDRYQLWGSNRLVDVSAVGNNKVEFKLNKPFPSLPYYLSTVDIVPKHIFSSQNPSTFLNKDPIGTGPFKFNSINESAIILDANKNYFLGAPHIDHLVIDRYNNSSTLTLALEKGNIEGTDGTIAMPSLPKLMQNPAMKLQKFPGLSNYVVAMNNAVHGLDDVSVRRAIELAINRKALIQKGEQGAVFPANPGFLPGTFGDNVDSSLITDPAYSYNPQKAESLLETDGYKKDSQGIYAKNGKELSFTYYMAASAPAQDKEGTMITGWLKQVGIKTTVKTATWPELTKLLMSGSYDLLQNGITVPPDPQAALEVFSSEMTAPIGKSTPGLNYMRFKNTQVDQLLSEASTTFDTTKRANLYKQVQQKIAQLAPVAPMYNVGGHIPYRTDKFTNYDTNVPVMSAISLSQIQPK